MQNLKKTFLIEETLMDNGDLQEGEAPWRQGAQTALTAGHGGCQP